MTPPERCSMELCPNWTGDGRVCPCALFGLDAPSPCPGDCIGRCRCDDGWDDDDTV